MRLCVVGAGAIGGLVAARVHLRDAANTEVLVLERGAHLATIRQQGLRLLDAAGREEGRAMLRASDSAGDIGPVDAVILALKAPDVAAAAPGLQALFGPRTLVLTLQNGIPWWYFERHRGPYAGQRLHSLDPDGHIGACIASDRLLGGVAYPAARLNRPGTVQHVEGHRFALGELDGSASPRLERMAALFRRAGFKCHCLEDIRSEIWLKASGTVAFNPVSALTRASMARIARTPDSRQLVSRMMQEARVIAEKLGARLRVDLERRLAGAEAVGEHKTSMLQDLEAGRIMETDAIIGAVAELGRLTDTPTPTIDSVHACLQLLQPVQPPRGPLEAVQGWR